jgi:hypothetical protein
MPRPRQLLLVVLPLTLAGCMGSASRPTLPADAAGAGGAAQPAPSLHLTLDGVVRLPDYASDDAAALATCEPIDAGGWAYMYAGGTPFVSVELSVYAGAADGRAPGDFDLDIGAPAGQVRLVPSGRREGAKGTGTAVVEHSDRGVTITVNGSARTMQDGSNAGDTTIDLTLTCPR